MKNRYSLKKHILLAMGAIYLVVLVLLLVLDIYSISNYQKTNRQDLMSDFSSAKAEIENRIQDLNDFVLESYSNNAHVNTLISVRSDTEWSRIKTYNAAYDFSKYCDSRMRIDTAMSGYYFSYGSEKRYGFRYSNTNQSGVNLRKTLLEGINNFLETSDNTSGSFLINTDEVVHYVVYYKKGYFSIACSTELFGGSFISDKARRSSSLIIESAGNYYYQDSSLNNFTGDAQVFTAELIKLDVQPDTWEKVILENKMFYVYKAECSKADGYLYGIVSVQASDIAGGLQVFLIILTVLSIVGLLFLYRFIQNQFIHPLYEMTEKMNEIRSGRWEAKMPEDINYEEIDEVGRTLNLLLSEIERMKIASYEERLDKQRTIMQYLQLQLKPHFYLNCMKMLNVLAAKSEYGHMQDLIINISAHLRYLLYNKDMLVCIRDEIAYVRNYLELQQGLSMRQIECEYHIDNMVLEWKVPILSIQTFIENSVKYAVPADEEAPLRLQVSVLALSMENEDYADICIRDNGNGYSNELLELLNGSETTENTALGVGITNLKKRFALFYNKPVVYDFHNQDGAVSEMIVPRKDESANESVDCG